MDMNGLDRRSTSFPQLLTSTITVFIGVAMHLTGLSMIEVGVSKAPELAPNMASVLCAFSIVRILLKLSVFWPRLRYIKVLLIPYITEAILRYVWVGLAKWLHRLCHRLGEYLSADWIGEQGYVIVRFSLALVVFLFMLVMPVMETGPQAWQTGARVFSDSGEEGGEDYVNGETSDGESDRFPLEVPSLKISCSSLPDVPVRSLLEVRSQSYGYGSSASNGAQKGGGSHCGRTRKKKQ